MAGSSIQMPQAGYLSVQHSRLVENFGAEQAVFKTSWGRNQFTGKDTIAGKPDLSTFWLSSGVPSLDTGLSGANTGIVRFTNPYDDQQLVFDSMWCNVYASSDGSNNTEMIPALEANPGNYASIFNPIYVPTTNELWFMASDHTGGIFVGDMDNSIVATEILKVDADSQPGDAVNVDSNPNNYYYNIIFGGSISDYFQCNLKYDHVRDCIWSYTRNNDVSFIGDQQLDNAYSTGYVSLRKFSTGGALLSETMLQTWSLLSWNENTSCDGGYPVLFGLQPRFSVGDDGLLWYTTDQGAEYPDAIYGTQPGTPFGGYDPDGNQMRMLRSYNPDTGEYTSYPNHWWSNECPGFLKDGRLLMWKAEATGAGMFVAFDPATNTATNIGKPGILSTQSGGYFYPQYSTIFTGNDFDYNGIFISDNSQSYYQLIPGGFGLTVTSADFTTFDRPWETTPTPIHDTVYGQVHEATYGPFKKGDHVRVGLLLNRDPAQSDLCMTRTLVYVSYVVNGETRGAWWDYDDVDTMTISWGQTDDSNITEVAETVISFSPAESIEVIDPEIVDTTIRIVTLDEVVPIRYDQEALPLPDTSGCPNDNEGLSFRSNIPQGQG
jgi:hypothetical protein